MGFWTDIFPNLNDVNPYNNFKSHFRIMGNISINFWVASAFIRFINLHHKNHNADWNSNCNSVAGGLPTQWVIETRNYIWYRGFGNNFSDRFITAILNNIISCLEIKNCSKYPKYHWGHRLIIYTHFTVAPRILSTIHQLQPQRIYSIVLTVDNKENFT